MRSGGQYVVCGAAPGTVEESIRLGKAGSDLVVSWTPGCSDDTADYGIYAGSLAAAHAGTYDHARVDCSDGAPLLEETISPGSEDSYYLVVPRGPDSEGSYGRASSGAEIPPALHSSMRCKELQDVTPCL